MLLFIRHLISYPWWWLRLHFHTIPMCPRSSLTHTWCRTRGWLWPIHNNTTSGCIMQHTMTPAINKNFMNLLEHVSPQASSELLVCGMPTSLSRDDRNGKKLLKMLNKSNESHYWESIGINFAQSKWISISKSQGKLGLDHPQYTYRFSPPPPISCLHVTEFRGILWFLN